MQAPQRRNALRRRAGKFAADEDAGRATSRASAARHLCRVLTMSLSRHLRAASTPASDFHES
jgi:hypothetical protein